MLLLPMLAVLAAVDEPSLELLVTGRSGGVSAHPTRMVAPDVLTAQHAGETLDVLHVGFRAVEHHGCYVLFQEMQTQEQVLKLLANPGRERAVRGTWPAALSPLDLTVDTVGGKLVRAVLERAERVPGLDALDPATAVHSTWTVEGAGLWMVETPRCTPRHAAETDVTLWELRSVTTLARHGAGPEERVYSVARPMGEGVRRHVATLQTARDARAPLVELLAGDDIEGASYVRRKSSLHRPVTVAALKARAPRVWVPQSAELHEGVAAFAELAREVGAQPVSANVALKNGKRPFASWARVDLGEVTVVVIGLTSPTELHELAPEVARGLTLEDPAPAAARALRDAVKTLGRWPDLVVALGVLSGAHAADVEELPGVDLALVRFEKQSGPARTQVEVAPTAARAGRKPLLSPLLSPLRLERIQVALARAPLGPERVTVHGTPLDVDLPVDEAITRAVQRIRQPVYAAADHDVLPDMAPLLGDAGAAVLAQADRDNAGTPRVGKALFMQLTAGALLERTGADVAVVPAPREYWKAGGGFSALRLQAAFGGPDILVALLLSPPELQKLLRDAKRDGLGISGANEDKAGGRPLDPRERYLVVTTDALATRLGLEGRIATRRFVTVGGRILPMPVLGKALPYRDAVVDALTAVGAGKNQPGWRRHLLQLFGPMDQDQPPRLILEARDVTVSVTDYGVFRRELYPQVPDPRVKTEPNYSLYGNGLLRGALETRFLNVEARLKAVWDRRVFKSTGVKDAANLWTASLEARVPWLGLDVPLLKWRMEPYAATAVDGQFVPLQRLWAFKGSGSNTDLAQARASVGLAFSGGGVMRELRVGALLHQDLVQLQVRLPEAWALRGATTGAETQGLFVYEAGPLSMEVTHLWRLLVPRPGVDTARDLLLTALTRGAVKGRVMEGLSLSAFADVYLFQGRMPGSQLGASYTLGLGVTLDRRYKPFTETAFIW